MKIFATKPVEHAAPELRVAADAIVRVRQELLTVAVDPAFGRPVAEMFPDLGRTPVLGFLRHEIATLDDEQPETGRSERVRHGAAAGAAADDDRVEVAHRASCSRLA